MSRRDFSGLDYCTYGYQFLNNNSDFSKCGNIGNKSFTQCHSLCKVIRIIEWNSRKKHKMFFWVVRKWTLKDDYRVLNGEGSLTVARTD